MRRYKGRKRFAFVYTLTHIRDHMTSPHNPDQMTATALHWLSRRYLPLYHRMCNGSPFTFTRKNTSGLIVHTLPLRVFPSDIILVWDK